jgi:hypothetical protein
MLLVPNLQISRGRSRRLHLGFPGEVVLLARDGDDRSTSGLGEVIVALAASSEKQCFFMENSGILPTSATIATFAQACSFSARRAVSSLLLTAQHSRYRFAPAVDRTVTALSWFQVFDPLLSSAKHGSLLLTPMANPLHALNAL